MIELFKYSDKEKKQLQDSIVILVDTREQKNSHITDCFDKYGIKWESATLKHGDYSFYVPRNDELDVERDLYFTSKCIIERKGSLEELSTNLTKGRDRLEKEFTLAPWNKVLLIENANYSDVVEGNYESNYNNKSFLASLHSFWFKYNLPVFFMPDNKYSALFIKKYFEYFLHDFLR